MLIVHEEVRVYQIAAPKARRVKATEWLGVKEHLFYWDRGRLARFR